MADQDIVSCPGCGKRYSLPPGVAPGQFQCQDCSAVVAYGRGVPPAGGGKPGVSAKTHARAAAAKRKLARDRASRDDGDEGDDRHRHGPPGGRKRQEPMMYLMAFATLGVVVGLLAWAYANYGADKVPKTVQKPGPGPASLTTGTVPGSTLEGASPPAPEPRTPPTPAGGTAEARPPVPAAGPGGDGEAPRPTGGMKVETRSGGRDKPADVFKEAANPPTGGNYGKTQADILVRLKKERSSVVTDLDHLPDAAPDLRSKIDADVAKMADPNAGSDGLRAQDRLIKLGRPAIPRVLAATKGLDFSKYPSAREGALDCQLAAAVDHVLREITGYTAPPRLQYTPDSNLGDYTRCIDEWYVWWLTNGYRRETFYRKAEDAEEEKL